MTEDYEQLPIVQSDEDIQKRKRPTKAPYIPPTRVERAEFLLALSRRLGATLDLFTASLLFGFLLSGAIILNHLALYLLAAVAAPFLAPALGITLSPYYQPLKTFLHNTGGFLVASGLVFGVTALAGWVAHILPPFQITQAVQLVKLEYYSLALLAVGNFISVVWSIRSSTAAPLAGNVALVWVLWLPLGLAGFGLTYGNSSLWPTALYQFAFYTLIFISLGTLTWFIFGLRPMGVFGLLGIVILLAGSVFAIVKLVPFQRSAAQPVINPTAVITTQSTAQSTDKPAPAEISKTSQPILSSTSTATLAPAATETSAPTATPFLVNVKPNELGGVVMRSGPGYVNPVVTYVGNTSKVQILGERELVGDTYWSKVQTTHEQPIIGWIAEALLIMPTVTPSPTP